MDSVNEQSSIFSDASETVQCGQTGGFASRFHIEFCAETSNEFRFTAFGRMHSG